MSGPKVSDYELEQRRRAAEARRLEEERRRKEERRRQEEARRREEERRRKEEERRRREEERRRREEERKRQESLKSIGTMQARLKDMQAVMEKIMQNAEYMSATQDVSEVTAELQKELADMESGLKPYSSQVLKDVLEKEAEIKSFLDRKEKKFAYFCDRQEDWKQQTRTDISSHLEELFKNTEELMTKQQKEALERSRAEEDKTEQLIKETEEMKEKFQEFLKETEADTEAHQEVERRQEAFLLQVESGNYSGACVYYGMQKDKLNRLVEESRKRQEEKEQRELLYMDAWITYETACEMAGIQPQPQEHTVEGIRHLREETIRIEAELLALREAEIVRKEIEAVMEEMGYHVIGSREAERRGTVIRHQVFSYGDGTAIDVMETNGHISMEVVGLENSDRVPTEKESIALEEEMVSFCDDFDELEVMLRERSGIVVKKRHSKLSPSREYAKLLNISNFQMQKNVETFSEAQKKAEDFQRKQRDKRKEERRKRRAAGQGARRWQE